jgi:hypothetical protein
VGRLAVAQSRSGATASSGGADLATAARGKAGSGCGAGREAGSGGGGVWEGRIQWVRAGILDPATTPLFSHFSLPERHGSGDGAHVEAGSGFPDGGSSSWEHAGMDQAPLAAARGPNLVPVQPAGFSFLFFNQILQAGIWTASENSH